MANGTDVPPPQPAATPPTPAQPGDASGGGKRAGLVALVVVLIAGAGVAGYFIGDSAADASKAKKDGRAAGEAAVRAQYLPGTPGYSAIFDAGRAAGSAAGRRTGVALGVKQGTAAGFEHGHSTGKAQGVADGAAAALGNYPRDAGRHPLRDQRSPADAGQPAVRDLHGRSGADLQPGGAAEVGPN